MNERVKVNYILPGSATRVVVELLVLNCFTRRRTDGVR